MRPLRTKQLLEVWERGNDRHPIDRALVLLAFACPERTWDELSALPLGERNRLLLAARAASFGPRLDIVSRCPECNEPVEFEFEAPLADMVSVTAREVETELPAEGHLRLRLPNSRDLAVVAAVKDPRQARRQLIERCVLQADVLQAVADDPEGVTAELLARGFSEAVEANDPLAVIAFPLSCGSCEQRWRATLDPIDYIWQELGQRVTVLVREVHVLAKAYGWTESEVLSLAPARRRLYLEQVGA